MGRRFRIVSTLVAAAVATGFAGCSATRSVATRPVATLRTSHSDPREESIRQWNAWGDEHLHNGDIVFMRGDCYLLLGTVNFSKLATELTASRFSHIGLVAIENGQAWVYDLRTEGCLRTRFGELLAHRQLHQLAVKRHRQASPEALSRTAAFCRSVYDSRDRYDDQLRLDNDRLYCSELVEVAYREAGYVLSQPVRIRDFPNFDRHHRTIQFVRAVTSIEPDQEVLVPGNDDFGIWANPDLNLVLDLPDTRVRPPR